MTLAWYKGFSPQQREASLKLTKLAIKNGDIPPANALGCKRCGQSKGIIDYHNEDYSHPTKFLEPLCFICHMVHHSIKRDPEGCAKYWRDIAAGKRYPPQYSRNINVLYTLKILGKANRKDEKPNLFNT